MQRNTVETAAPSPSARHPLRGWTAALVGLGIVVPLFAAPPQQQNPQQNIDRPYLLPEANRLPDKNDQMMMNEQQSKKQSFEAANTERRKQIAGDAEKLVELATQLKAEVDKTDKDTLSINVIRKAELIEKLAKGVKEKMKLTIGPS